MRNFEIPSLEQSFLYKFLQISPSYYLAHKYRNDENSCKTEIFPDDFDQVLKTYEHLGDVFNHFYDNWWDNIGKKQVPRDKSKAKLIFKVDLTKSKEIILNEFNLFLDEINLDLNGQSNEGINYLTNKIQLSTLHDRHALVISNCANELKINFKNGKKPYWKLLMEGFHHGKDFVNKSKALSKIEKSHFRGQSEKDKKKYITMLVSKRLKEALYISENAARGIFPSTKPVKGCLQFNYNEIDTITRHDFFNTIKAMAGRLETGELTYPTLNPEEMEPPKIHLMLEKEKKNKFKKRFKKDFEERGFAEYKVRDINSADGRRQYKTIKIYAEDLN